MKPKQSTPLERKNMADEKGNSPTPRKRGRPKKPRDINGLEVFSEVPSLKEVILGALYGYTETYISPSGKQRKRRLGPQGFMQKLMNERPASYVTLLKALVQLEAAEQRENMSSTVIIRDVVKEARAAAANAKMVNMRKYPKTVDVDPAEDWQELNDDGEPIDEENQ